MSEAHARRAWLRLFGLTLTAVLVGLSAMTYRALSEGEAELAAAETAFDRGELRAAIRHARRSASLVVPGSSHVDRAFFRLYVIARGAEAAGDVEAARLAWEAVRGASLEARSPFAEPADPLLRANENLARLAARSGGERLGADAAAIERALARDLARDVTRSPFWPLSLFLGLALSALGLAWVSLRGIDGSGLFVRREVAIGVALALAGAAFWGAAVYAV